MYVTRLPTVFKGLPTIGKELPTIRTKLVVVDLTDDRIIRAYAELSTLAKEQSLAIFHDKNDLWIAAAMAPKPGQVIGDPACGTGGFLLAAHDFISQHNKLSKPEMKHLRTQALRGRRPVLKGNGMNSTLHLKRQPASS